MTLHGAVHPFLNGRGDWFGIGKPATLISSLSTCQVFLSGALSHLFSLQPLTPNGEFAGIFSRFAIINPSLSKRRPRPSGFAGTRAAVAPSERVGAKNRMLNQCHRFSACAATKPCISRFVRKKFRQISYLPRASWPKPLKTRNLTKTTPRGEWGVAPLCRFAGLRHTLLGRVL